MKWRLSCEVAALLWKLGQVMARQQTGVPSGEKIRGHHSCRDHAGYSPFGPPGTMRPATTEGQLLEWPGAGDGIACYSEHGKMIIRWCALAKRPTVN